MSRQRQFVAVPQESPMVAQELDLSFDVPDEAEEGKEGDQYDDQGGELS